MKNKNFVFSRRHFLALTAVGATATITRKVWSQAIQDTIPIKTDHNSIRVWVTHSNKRFQLAPTLKFTTISAKNLEAIRINTEQKYQEVLGFGAAFTDASCFLFSQLELSKRLNLFKELFAPTDMGLNVCRTCVGSSDYSRTVYSYAETPGDWNLAHFSIAHDRNYILPMLNEARQANPELFIISSPWSPPGWMKTYNSMLGGWMQARYLKVYAHYYVRYLQEYAAAGVPIDALTPQNEVETDQDGRMPACLWSPELEMAFVRDYLGPMLKEKGLKTKIWIVDHNYSLWRRAKWILDHPDARKFIDGVGFHPYKGTPDMMSLLHKAYPHIGIYWTEGGSRLLGNSQYATEWCKHGKIFTAIMRNWCRSITAWNLALDEEGKPNIGSFKAGGLVTIHSQTKEVTYSGQFWAMGHFSKFVRRGAKRIESEGNTNEVAHVAFANPNNEIVLVITNPGQTRKVELQYREFYATLKMPANSMITAVWSA